MVARGESRLAAMDIGWAQELLGSVGRLSSIQILLKNPAERRPSSRGYAGIAPQDAISRSACRAAARKWKLCWPRSN